MGVEPVEEDTPPDISDFPALAQQALLVYNCLKDCWDPMGGNYLGKDLNIVFELFNMFEVEQEDKKFCFKLIQHIDSCRSDLIQEKLKSKKPSSTHT